MSQAAHEQSSTLANGITGLVATVGSIGISLADVNAFLTTVSLLVGITVGILTARNLRKKK